MVNEGLLNLDGTKLDDKSIENQYVVTFLGGTGSSDNCEKITSTTSWSNNQAVYLCMNGSGGSNLATIDPTKYGNRTYVSNEPYYFKGLAPNNWVNLPENVKHYEDGIKSNLPAARIVYVDSDDSIIIVLKEYDTRTTKYTYFLNNNNLPSANANRYATISEDISLINSLDSTYVSPDYFSNYILCSWYFCYTNRYSYRYDTFSNTSVDSVSSANKNEYNSIRLPNTCKIVSGTGAEDNRYNIECK